MVPLALDLNQIILLLVASSVKVEPVLSGTLLSCQFSMSWKSLRLINVILTSV